MSPATALRNSPRITSIWASAVSSAGLSAGVGWLTAVVVCWILLVFSVIVFFGCFAWRGSIGIDVAGAGRMGMTIICRPPLLKRNGVTGSVISMWVRPNCSALVRNCRLRWIVTSGPTILTPGSSARLHWSVPGGFARRRSCLAVISNPMA